MSKAKQLEEAREIITDLVDMYVANRNGDSEFIKCITPESANAMTPTQRAKCPHWRAWDNARRFLGDKV